MTEKILVEDKQSQKDVRYDIVDYLNTKGWKVVLIDNHGVQKQTGVPYRYEYVMSFLGKHPDFPDGGHNSSKEKET